MGQLRLGAFFSASNRDVATNREIQSYLYNNEIISKAPMDIFTLQTTTRIPSPRCKWII